MFTTLATWSLFRSLCACMRVHQISMFGCSTLRCVYWKHCDKSYNCTSHVCSFGVFIVVNFQTRCNFLEPTNVLDGSWRLLIKNFVKLVDWLGNFLDFFFTFFTKLSANSISIIIYFFILVFFTRATCIVDQE